MLCKWCGAELPEFTTRCKRCKKDIPAISDCGGFYDLVPAAKKLADRGEPVRQTPVDGGFVRAAEKDAFDNSREKNNDRKVLGLQIALIVMCVALVALLLLNLKDRLGDDSSARDRDDGDIGIILDEGKVPGDDDATTGEDNPDDSGDATTGEDNPDDSTDATSGEDNPDDSTDVTTGEDDPDTQKIPLEEQELEFELEIEETDDGMAVKAEVTQGEIDAEISGRISDRADPSDYKIEIDLGEHKECLDIEIENTFGKDTKRRAVLSVEIDAENSVFARIDGKVEFAWEYRLDGLGKWEDLDESLFEVSREETTVIQSDELEALFGDAETVEFRLTYKRVNKKGGSLTVMISGIKLDTAFHTDQE